MLLVSCLQERLKISMRFDFFRSGDYVWHYSSFEGWITMPIFEFQCAECGAPFEKLFMNSEEIVSLSCPKCNSQTVERKLSQTNYTMSVGAGGKQPSITSKTCGSGNQCMSMTLPGHTK